MTRVVLFVCTGNLCRSPMAAAFFNAHAASAGEADQYIGLSAGTWAAESQPASGYAVAAMAVRGIDLTSHRAHEITAQAIDEADIVVVMTGSHREALSAEFPQARRKIHMMSELADRTYDIADPYGGAASEYEATAQQLERLISNGYETIKWWISGANSSS